MWGPMAQAFKGASNLTVPATDSPDLSSSGNLSEMFRDATTLNSSSLSTWDVSNVTNMSNMFYGATSFNQNLNSWDVSNVTNMSSMFSGATSFNQPLDAWNTTAVTSIRAMFEGASSFNQPIGSWDTSNVTSVFSVLHNASAFDQNIGNWSFENVNNLFPSGNEGMLGGSGMSTASYDASLAGWLAKPENNVPFYLWGDGLTYCSSAAARQSLIDDYGWTITDAGLDCSGVTLSPDDFVTTWKTDNAGSSNSTSITIPTTGSGYNYDVDWNNDGTFDQTGITGDVTHDFGSAGTKTIRIRGSFPRIYFNNSGDRQKILRVDQWGNQVWSSMWRSFYGASNLTLTSSDVPDLSNVTDLGQMFQGATSMNSNISNWDVSNVTSTVHMFSGATSFNNNINNWDVHNVQNMDYMFYGATSFNQPLHSWDVSGVDSTSSGMVSMFENATAFNQDISSWDVSNVTDMQHMLDNSAVSRANYDAILTAWAGQSLKNNVSLGASGLTYCNSQTDRASIISTHSWTISGDTLDCSGTGSPTNLTLNSGSSVNFNENNTIGATIGTLAATDPTPGDTFTYSLACSVAGADDSHFSVSGNTLRAGSVYDYEAPTDTNTDNTYRVCVRVTDASSNTYDRTFSVVIQNVDDTAPSKPTTPNLLSTSDTGSSSVDNITTDTTPTFRVSCSEADSVIRLRVITPSVPTPNVINTYTCTAVGPVNLTVSPALSEEGEFIFSITETDAAGNVSAASNGLSITLDMSDPTPASYESDTTTNDTTPVFSGNGTNGDTVTVKDDDGTVLCETTVSGGSWSCSSSETLDPGDHTITIETSDEAGNSVSSTITLTVTGSDNDTNGDSDGNSDSDNNGSNGSSANNTTATDTAPNGVTSTITLSNPSKNNPTTCKNLKSYDVVTESKLHAIDPDFNYPLGLQDFTVRCVTPGDSVRITVSFAKAYDTSNWQWRKYHRGNNSFDAVEDVTFATTRQNGKRVTTASFVITDGGVLDEDGKKNGVIVDPSGPAIPVGQLLAPDTGVSKSFNFGFVTHMFVVAVAVSLLLLAGILWRGAKA